MNEEDIQQTKGILNELLSSAKLYQNNRDYWELLQFVVKLRNVAPFNAMLLHIQKPGIRYVASHYEWQHVHHRELKLGARPLVILWPFAPVLFVYDVEDTIGENLPQLAYADSFTASGSHFNEWSFRQVVSTLKEKNIFPHGVDIIESYAGSIKKKFRKEGDELVAEYQINYNENHPPTVKLATLIHELGHLFLGHLGADKLLGIKGRTGLSPALRELEAESLSYLICSRIDITTNSGYYLAGYIDCNDSVESLEIYELMKATNRIEQLFGWGGHIKFK